MTLITVLDKNFSPFKAIKYSGMITYGYKGKLFSLCALVIAIGFLQLPFYHFMLNKTVAFKQPFMITSLVLYVVSVFVLIPWMSVAWATAYNCLSKKSEESAID